MADLAIHLSHTRLKEILLDVLDNQGNVIGYEPGCLYAHEQREYLHVEEPTNELADVGLRFHAFAMVYVLRLIKYKRWQDLKAATDIMGGFTMKDPRLTMREVMELERLCRIFLSGYEHLDGEIFCERRFAYRLPDLEPCDPNLKAARIAGSIDHLRIKGDQGYVLDYKSGPGANFATYNAYRDQQLQMYCWLASMAYPEVRQWSGTIWGLARGPKNKASAEWTPEVLNGLVLPRVMAGYAIVKAEHAAKGLKPWTARGNGQNCKYCSPGAIGCPLLCKLYEPLGV